MKYAFLLVLACLVIPAQTQGPAADPPEKIFLDKAYAALREKKYLEAITHLRAAAQAAPRNPSIRKDLGYAYLRVGETEWAREVFEQALTLEPKDDRIALELAFLYYETGQEARALELLDRVRRSPDPALQKTAAETFAHADGELRAAIERWSAAVRQDPSNRAARLELARNLEKHREPARAVEQYLAAWRLPPRREETLLDLARARHEAGDEEGAIGAWLLASRSAETRVSERARARLPRRDPFANEYRRALELDPAQAALRRDLAFLWLAVKRQDEALREFETVVQQDSLDMLAAAQLGFLYLERRQPARALPLLEKVAAGPDSELARRAREALGKKQPSRNSGGGANGGSGGGSGADSRGGSGADSRGGSGAGSRGGSGAGSRSGPGTGSDGSSGADSRGSSGAGSRGGPGARSGGSSGSSSGRSSGRSSPRELALPHKQLGEKSLTLSYLNDARRELQIAHEIDPDDLDVALKLGVLYNLLHDDREALRWFRLALASPEPAVAAEARRSYNNLAPQFRRVQVSLWTLPMFSTRFHDAFQYAQLKAEFRLGRLPVRPYLSLRLVGDWKRRTVEPLPQFLSESSLIGALGLRTPAWNGLTLWGEAGEAASYLHKPPPGTPRLGPDYRGGLAWSRNLGASLGGETAGAFAELNVDAVFLSRYANNVISYWQMRHGYRLPQIGFLRSQLFWNTHVTFDRRRDYYANFVEFGPGFRFRVPRVSPPLDVTISGLRGVYLINAFNPRRPNYYDLRLGLWYSVSR